MIPNERVAVLDETKKKHTDRNWLFVVDIWFIAPARNDEFNVLFIMRCMRMHAHYFNQLNIFK